MLFESAREGVLSWNSFADRGLVEFRLLRAHQPATQWFPYAQWETDTRKSFSAEGNGVRVDVDVVTSSEPFDGIDVRIAGVEAHFLAFATPARVAPSMPYFGDARILDVPARSQYVVEGERGWCSAASLSMLNAFFGLDYGVEATARAVFDRAYNGTGNWAFNAAFSGSLGLRAALVYLRNLDHAQHLIDAGIPLALSYSWSPGELPNAPVEHSAGHLVVLCGFAANGDCAINDPAATHIRVVYPRSVIERLWHRNNGAAYVVAPVGLDFVEIANA